MSDSQSTSGKYILAYITMSGAFARGDKTCAHLAMHCVNKISSSVLNVGRQYTIDNQGPLSVTRALRQPNSKS